MTNVQEQKTSSNRLLAALWSVAFLVAFGVGQELFNTRYLVDFSDRQAFSLAVAGIVGGIVLLFAAFTLRNYLKWFWHVAAITVSFLALVFVSGQQEAVVVDTGASTPLWLALHLAAAGAFVAAVGWGFSYQFLRRARYVWIAGLSLVLLFINEMALAAYLGTGAQSETLLTLVTWSGRLMTATFAVMLFMVMLGGKAKKIQEDKA